MKQRILTPKSDSVIPSFPANKSRPRSLPFGSMIRQRDLHGGVNGCRSTHGEKHLAESSARHELEDFVCESEWKFVTHVETRSVVKLIYLLFYSLKNFRL
jgi:hypothetical protein